MVSTKFSDCFWNAEFNSNIGFDILVKRMKDGRNSYKELMNFVKDRAKIEEDYAKALLRLSRCSLASTESGSLKEILTAVKGCAEKAGNLHMDMSQSLGDQAQRIHTLKDQFAQTIKQTEEVVRKAQNSKKDLYHKTNSSQQNYHRKCASYETAQSTYATEKSSGVKQAKDLEKMENKAHKCKEEKLKADDAYQNLVKQLDAARVNWENEMENACEVFEQAEHERIVLFRNELWVMVNVESKTLFEQDEMNERAREAMERCDPQKDLQDFMDGNQTGSKRPAPIPYESCDSKPTPHTNRPPRPAAPGASTFFEQDGHQHASFPDDDEIVDPTYASIS